jgi:hypothetical protein
MKQSEGQGPIHDSMHRTGTVHERMWGLGLTQRRGIDS